MTELERLQIAVGEALKLRKLTEDFNQQALRMLLAELEARLEVIRWLTEKLENL